MSQKPKKTRAEQLFREAELKEESRDRKGSFLAMKESAELGYRMAQVNLGNMYASGWGTAKDRNRAEYWYKASFRQGSSTGALNMGVDLQKQGRIRSAKIWLKRAASMGNGKALVLLAKLYLEHGPPKCEGVAHKRVELRFYQRPFKRRSQEITSANGEARCQPEGSLVGKLVPGKLGNQWQHAPV